MLRRRRWWTLTAIPVVLATGTVAVAALTGPPLAERVEAEIVFESAVIKDRSCVGQGGRTYYEDIVVAKGTSTGGDRLSGEVTLRVRTMTDEFGDGFQAGSLEVRDPDTGGWGAQGEFTSAGDGDVSQGIVVGRTRTPAVVSGDRSRLYGGLRTTFNADGSVVAQIGGEVDDLRLPAVVVDSACKGRFETSEVDIPEPGDESGGGAGWQRLVR